MAILKGKIIKKDEIKLVKMLDIQSYPWLNFQESSIVFPDNPRKSVILRDAHDPKEMQEKVKDALQFQQPLASRSTPLYPVDLTADYETSLREMVKRKRRRMMGEEEAMALELAEISSVQHVHFQTAAKPSAPESPLSPHFEVPHQPVEQDVAPAPAAEPTTSSVRENVPPPAPAAPSPVADHIAEAAPLSASDRVQETMQAPAAGSGSAEGTTSASADENLAAQEKKEHAGFEKGYLEGFRTGEEKAALAQEAKYEGVFRNVSLVVAQMETLKNALYKESQEVFLEIVKLCSQKILREQIRFSDSALKSLFDQVISTFSQNSTMKIELNASDLERLKVHIEELGIQDKVTLIEDNSKENGDFTVENQRGVSVVNLEKTLSQILEKLRSELLNPDADQHTKVG